MGGEPGLRSRLVEQLAGCLTYLPVPVFGCRPQRRRDPRVVEAGQGDRGASSHRRGVVQCAEDGREPGSIAQGPQRGHRGFAAAGVFMVGRGRRQHRHGGVDMTLGQEPGGADHDERVGVAQRASDGAWQRRTGAGAPGAECHLDGTAADRRPTDGQCHLDVAGRQLAQARQGAERGHLHAGVGVGQALPGQRGVPVVPGQGDAPAPNGGAAAPVLIRGNIVAHLLSMSEPDASADGDAAANPTLSDAGPGAGDAPGPPPFAPPVRRRRRWPTVFGVVVAILVVAVLIANHISVNDYVITPGEASPVAPYIEVPAADNHPLTGTILLTDVFVTQLNALSYLQYKYFDSDSEVISGPELLGPATNQDQYLDQGYLQMAQAQSYATAAALSRLGYTVTSTNAGALIYGIATDSPAASTLHVAQVITAVNDTPVTTDCSLVTALHGLTPGTKAALTVEESSINNVGQFVSGPTVTKSVTLGTPPKGLIDSGCGAPTKPTAYLGIEPQTQQDWQFPVKVTVHTQNIGGPSAGLAMTLGIMDKLSSGRLTGNRIVAATGTIDQNGTVGDVGGVAEKTIAVERAGATVFFVPSVEFQAAESKATPQLHVYAVNNLDQVLRILTRLGGKVPTKPVSVQAAP